MEGRRKKNHNYIPPRIDLKLNFSIKHRARIRMPFSFDPAVARSLLADLKRANTEAAKKERFSQYLTITFARDAQAQELISVSIRFQGRPLFASNLDPSWMKELAYPGSA